MWKLGLAALALTVAGIGMMLSKTLIDSISAGRFATVMLACVVMALGALVFACIAIRCPRCRAPWVWMAVSGQGHGVWLPWLMSLRQCPRCSVRLTV